MRLKRVDRGAYEAVEFTRATGTLLGEIASLEAGDGRVTATPSGTLSAVFSTR